MSAASPRAREYDALHAQLAHAVAGMKGYEERKARERQGKRTDLTSMPRGTEVGRTAELLAAKVGVSTRTVNRAIHVREQGTEELNAAVASGEITVNQADKIAQFKPATPEDFAAEILAHASGVMHWFSDDGAIGIHGVAGDRCAHALAAARLTHAEEPMMLAYAFNRLEHARLVVAYAGICGIHENVAWFALAKMLNPSRFAAGALSDFRPPGRRADVDREIRLADALYRKWLRRAAVAFVGAYFLPGDPLMSGEIQNPAGWQDVG